MRIFIFVTGFIGVEKALGRSAFIGVSSISKTGRSGARYRLCAISRYGRRSSQGIAQHRCATGVNTTGVSA